jgi:hypothetical protein
MSIIGSDGWWSCKMIMVGHLNIPSLIPNEKLPSSLSKEVINYYLRNELCFNGIVITDALNMKGVTNDYTNGEAEVLALMAGVDILLMPDNAYKAVSAILQAIKDNRISIEDIEKWNLKTGIMGKGILISEKLDGISLELNYSKGKFVRAVTRGDGVEGDDITENAIYFNGVVKELQEPWDCAVRGEVMIVKDNLEKINKILVSNGKEPLKNTRNGVAGQATKFKERNEEILSLITFLAYELQVFQIHETGENVL